MSSLPSESEHALSRAEDLYSGIFKSGSRNSDRFVGILASSQDSVAATERDVTSREEGKMRYKARTMW